MRKKSKPGFFFRNGLSLVFALLMLASITGQVLTGWREHNDELLQHGSVPKSIGQYLVSGHFLQATFENWESEFLQMALFVVFTVFLYQKGSSESNPIGEPDEQKRNELQPKADSPWPVKKGGIALAIYKHSLSISLFLLFAASFMIHWYGSWKDYNEKQVLEAQQVKSFIAYLYETKFWFESFQNWQSEFLSVLAIILLSVYLREKGSSQSKPVNAPHHETGE